ncbi:MAG: hypothetical protein M3P47_06440, partial [Pseudomonadota bacterium]|nr:hypothetical protein [Pseudomonadota bacterium]
MLNKTITFSVIRLLSFCLPGLLSYCLLFLSAPLYAVQITLNVADVAAPNLTARGIKVVLAQEGSAEFSIAELHMAGKIWHKVHVHCTEFLLSSARVTCRKGKWDAIPDLPFTFDYEFASQRLELRLAAKANELWQVSADFRAQPWRATALLRNAQGKRLAGLLSPDWPLP